MPLTRSERALVALGRWLEDSGYRFTTITPASHERVLARPHARAPSLRDIFGWSRSFEREALPAAVLALLDEAHCIEPLGAALRSRVRFSTLGDGLYVHSSHPTVDDDAVFFGPDSYRFARLLRERVIGARTVIDIGAGSGVGGLCIADRVERILLTDINETAHSFAKVNAELAGVLARIELVHADVLRGIDERADLIIANPPYIADPKGRAYRDGGRLGIELTVRITREALEHLGEAGQLILYSGAPIIDGVDQLRREVMPFMPEEWTYEELDPDVFGEELSNPEYRDVERLAAIALWARR